MPVRKIDPLSPVMPGMDEPEEELSTPTLPGTLPPAPKQFELRVPQAGEQVTFILPADEEVVPVGKSGEGVPYWITAGTVIRTSVNNTKRARVQQNIQGAFWIFFVELDNDSSTWVEQDMNMQPDTWSWKVYDESLVQP